jgi:YcxB-like protein
MTSQNFTYNKAKVIQALRYHFITRLEIKALIILVNVFAITSAALFFFHKISPVAFLISTVLWIALMIVFWFLLPNMVYKKADTFKDHFTAILTDKTFRIENDRGGRSWDWAAFSTWLETPHFFHLYFNSRSFFIVPKDAFENENVHAARKILQDNIVKK